MAQATQTYKRSLSGSVGAGLSSVFSRAGRTYYILEHKVSSKYHKAGEAQEIIVDQIEIGRDSKCQVQFDESFKTVSRRHAAIVRDGDNWKLIQLSQTNTTFLNGRPVKNEWYLQNGDEIQLSVNGPKLGFIIPSGNKATTGSIGLSRRLSLFRQQALKPYKTAMSIMAACIVLLLCGGIGYGVWAHKQMDNLLTIIAQYRTTLDDLSKQNNEMARLMEQQDSINAAIEKRNKALERQMRSMNQHAPQNVQNLLDKAKPSIYYIVTKVYICVDDEEELVGSSSGTGFLMADGRFVTARHCVESWLFDKLTSEANVLPTTYPNLCKAYTKIYARNSEGRELRFTSDNFVIDRSLDRTVDWTSDDGTTYKSRLVYYISDRRTDTPLYGTNPKMGAADWAYATMDANGYALPKGTLTAAPAFSRDMPAGTEAHVMGFPAGLGVDDSENKNERIEPIYNSMKVARSGLNNSGMIMVSQGVAHGNSGGPVFAIKDGNLNVIGIVSRLMWQTQRENQQQQQYDELVPISQIYK